MAAWRPAATTPSWGQIDVLCGVITNPQTRSRLILLATAGYLARWQRPSSAPYHYTIGPRGAAITAARAEAPAL